MKINSLSNKLKTPNKLLIIGVTVINLFSKLLYLFFLVKKNPTGILFHDSYEYIQLARNLSLLGIFSREAAYLYYPEHIRTPGYPLFLNLLQNSGIAICIAQIVLNSLTLFIFLNLFLKVNTSKKGLIALAALFIFNPGNYIFSNAILTEGLSLFFIALIVWTIYHFRDIVHSILGGILIGLLILIKPIFIFLPLLLLLLNRIRKDLKKSLALLIIPAFFIGSWSCRNYTIFKTVFYSNVTIQNLAFYRAAEIDAVKEGMSLELAQDLVRENTYQECKNRFNGIYEHDTPIYYHQLKSDAINKIKNNPGLYLKLSAKNLLKLLFNPYNPYIQLQWDIKKPPTNTLYLGAIENFKQLINSYNTVDYFILVTSLVFSVVLLISIVIFIYNLIQSSLKPIETYLFIFILYLIFLSIGPEGDARLRYMAENLSVLLLVLQLFKTTSYANEEKFG